MPKLHPLIFAGMLFIGAAPALAHVPVDATSRKGGELSTMEFRVMHGCDGAPTTSVRVEIPDGVTRVTPRALAGWAIAIEKRPLPKPVSLHGVTVTDTTAAITWSGGSLEDAHFEAFTVRAQLPPTPGRLLSFRVAQACANGESFTWGEKKPGQTHDTPGPTLKVE